MNDEVRAAHARIESLERELAGRRRARPAISGVLALLVSALASAVIFCLSTIVALVTRPRTVEGVVYTGLPPPVAPVTAKVAPTFWNGPATALVNADEVEDIIALWRHHDATYELVAVDGRTLAPLWRRAVNGDDVGEAVLKMQGGERVLLANGKDMHAYAVKTGTAVGGWTFDSLVGEICPFEDGSAKVHVEEAIIDLETATRTPAPRGTSTLACHGRSDVPLCGATKRKVYPCEGEAGPNFYAAFENANVVARIGWAKDDKPYFGVFTSKIGPRIEPVRAERLGLAEDAGFEREVRVAFAKNTLVVAYRKRSGAYQLVGYDASSGKQSWTAQFGKESTDLRAFKGTAQRIYLSLADEIRVYAPDDGALVHTLRESAEVDSP